MMRIVQTFILCSIIWFGCRAQQENIYFENLNVNGIVPYDEMVEWCNHLVKLGKDAIPQLIDDISREERVILGLGRAHLSFFPTYYWEKNYQGIRSAYFIEFLLSTGIEYQNPSIEMNKEVQSFLVKMHHYYVYPNNVILKNDDQILEYDDILTLKNIYAEWWERNRLNTLDDLKVIHKKKPILEGSIYYWK